MSAPPPIDRRTFDDLVAQAEQLLERYSGWRPAPSSDAGGALVRVFARLSELVIDRLNGVPDKNFLAFLDLVGLDLLPPQPARAPITFHLAAGSLTDAAVPARTAVAAPPPEGEQEPVTFETEQDLVVTRTQLAAAFSWEPARDRFADHTAFVAGGTEGSFPVFEGDAPIPHRLFLGDPRLATTETEQAVRVRFRPALEADPWPAALAWSGFDGTSWRPLAARSELEPGADAWLVTVTGVPLLPPAAVAGRSSSWLRADLRTPVPHGELAADAAAGGSLLSQGGLLPDAGFAGPVALDFTQPVYPFGRLTPRDVFAVACNAAFSKPGARVTLAAVVGDDPPPRPRGDLELAWEYWNGNDWRELGRSSPGSTSAGAAGVDDETRALTRDGAITFRAPADWAATTVEGVEGYWLRARIATGDYGPAEDYRPPALTAFRAAYVWPLPRITGLEVSPAVRRTALAPDLAFANQTPVDLTKDFFPFGETPRFGDTFYLASDAALARAGARVALEIRLTNPDRPDAVPPPAQPSSDLVLRWEFWNARESRWELVGESGPGAEAPARFDFVDETNAFTREGAVRFTVADTLGATTVSGQQRRWIRARLAAGDYGRAAEYRLKDPQAPDQGFVLIPATFRPPSVRSMEAGYDYEAPFSAPLEVLAENDFLATDRRPEVAAGQVFEPFTATLDQDPALYLGFTQPGDQAAFANRAATLYFGVEEVLYGDVPADRPRPAEPPGVVWEYWDGGRWTRLGTRDETGGFTERGLVTFIGPPDFQPTGQFGRAAFWLRARLERGGYLVMPRLRRVLTNTTWAIHATAVQDELLGSSTGERDQLFRTAKAPVLPGQRIEVREAEVPSAPERAAIEAEEGTGAITIVADAGGRPLEVWVRWHEVVDFFASGPRSRHYVLDRRNGEVRFGDGQRGLAPPPGRSNVRAAWYESGGGASGNLPAGSLAGMQRAVPYVDRASNPEPAAGGSAGETLEALRVRGPRTLRHRDRAIAMVDFEDLAFQVSPDVARVKGIPATSDVDAGSVGLILVPRSAGDQPAPSLELVSRVEAYLRARLSPTADLWVSGPDWLKVSVTAEVVPVSLEAVADLQALILARLAHFLHPLTGSLEGTGWDFGRKPYRSDLFALIESVPGVDHVRRLNITEQGDVRPGRYLVFSGAHQVLMVSGNG